MEEQTENFEIPSRWRRFSAYLLDLIINIIILCIIPYVIFTLTDWNIFSIIIGIILLIFEIILILLERNSIWNELVWIFALNKEDNTISKWQSILRFFIFNPAFLPLLQFLIWFLISLMLYMINSYSSEDIFIYNLINLKTIRLFNKISRLIFFIGLILLFINIIEIFFKCPTFIDKRLWIKRFYEKSKKYE